MFFKEATRLPNIYFARYVRNIDVSLRLDPSCLAQSLSDIAIKHFQKYAFHSLCFNLNKEPIELEKSALINQLIDEQGGSCFHHNVFFQAILENSGIESWFVRCLVRDPAHPEVSFQTATHIAIIFKHQENLYLFDPGWDGSSFATYPLPTSSETPTSDHGFQVRKKEASESMPFVFEEIKPDSSVVPRYDFDVLPSSLADFQDAIVLLNANTYAFHHLFLYTQITKDNEIVRFINRTVIKQKLTGDERHTEVLEDTTSPIQTINELFDIESKIITSLNANHFKNPELGEFICNPISPSQKLFK